MNNEAVATITREELREKIEAGDGFALVDTLDEDLYQQSHLPGAINLPLEEVDKAEEALPNKNAEIVVYCMSPI